MIDFVLGVVVGVVLLWTVQFMLRLWIIKTVRKIAELEKLKEIQESQIIIAARVEEINGEFFLYRVDNDEFLAQGSSFVELYDRVDTLYPGRTVIVSDGEHQVREKLKSSASM